MNKHTTTHNHGFSTEGLATALGLRPASIRVHLCRRGSYYGLTPERLPNGRLLWPSDSVEKLKTLGRSEQ